MKAYTYTVRYGNCLPVPNAGTPFVIFTAMLPMENRFSAAMAKRTDKELIKMTGVYRTDYDPLAVEAAEYEIRKRNLDARFIETVKAELEVAYQQEALASAKSELKFSRGVHLFVDTFMYYLLGFALSIAGMWVVAYSGMPEAEVWYRLWVIMLVFSFFAYYVGMELAFGRTVGKFNIGTKVVMKDGSKPGFEDILKRTACRLIPLDAVMFLAGKEGFHDSLSDTTVIKIEKDKPL